MPELTEEQTRELALRARDGDSRAFDALREHYRAPLRRYLMLELRGKRAASDDDLDDLEQRVWIGAYDAMSKFDPERGSFYQFLKGCVAKWEALRWGPDRRLVSLDEQEEDVYDRLLTDPDADPANLMDVESQLSAQVEAFHLLCRLVFLCGGYPHQQLAFAFLKVIYAGGAKAQGSAAAVVKDHADTALARLSESFVGEYRKLSGLGAGDMSRISSCADPLRQRLGLTVGVLMQRDPASLHLNARLVDTGADATTLEDYYSGHKQTPTAAVSDWAYGVQKRVVGAFAEVSESCADGGPKRSSICTRCKLRSLPPCNELEGSMSAALGGSVGPAGLEWLQDP